MSACTDENGDERKRAFEQHTFITKCYCLISPLYAPKCQAQVLWPLLKYTYQSKECTANYALQAGKHHGTIRRRLLSAATAAATSGTCRWPIRSCTGGWLSRDAGTTASATCRRDCLENVSFRNSRAYLSPALGEALARTADELIVAAC